MRFELRAHHAADKNEMITRFVQRLALAFERHQRASKKRHPRLPRRPGQVRKTILAFRREAVRRRLLSDLKHIDPEVRRVAKNRRRSRRVRDANEQQRRIKRDRGETVRGKSAGFPLPSSAVTMVTPVAKQPIASRRVRGSDPALNSIASRGCRLSRKSRSWPSSASSRSTAKAISASSISTLSPIGSPARNASLAGVHSAGEKPPRTTSVGSASRGAAATASSLTGMSTSTSPAARCAPSGASACAATHPPRRAATTTGRDPICANTARRSSTCAI
jgi:hypothetical protein